MKTILIFHVLCVLIVSLYNKEKLFTPCTHSDVGYVIGYYVVYLMPKVCYYNHGSDLLHVFYIIQSAWLRKQYLPVIKYCFRNIV